MLKHLRRTRVLRKTRRLVEVALLALFVLAGSLPAFSQSCALCYTQAASASARMIDALRSGILILIVPPTLLSIGMIFILYRKRAQYRQPANLSDSAQKW
jgi:hypothetical protein